MTNKSNTYQAPVSLRIAKACSAYAIANFKIFKEFKLFAICLMVLFASISLSSCGNKSAEDIESEFSSGVVLIQNKSYYEAKLSNGNSLYFTRYDKDEGIVGLTADMDSIDRAISYGTGFFVSSDGKIATNHHVVADKIENQDITNSITNLIDALKSALSDEYNELYEKYEAAQNLTEIARYDDDFSVSEYREIKDYRDSLGEELNTYVQIYAKLNELRPENSEILYHNEISIGYNDTFVTTDSDLKPCVIRKTDKNRDLAIIQLKDKKTPEDKYVFNIKKDDPLEAYNFVEKMGKALNQDKNDQIYMPAFNLGPSLAITDDGLKLQFGSGQISRKTSDEVMYSIPSLPGSSGSPILNKKGEVIAVNSAGIKGSDSFNSGIRIKHLQRLMNE